LFSIYSSVAELPSTWDVCRNAIYSSRRAYLGAEKKSAPTNMHSHFIGIFLSNPELVGIALSFANLSDLNSFGEKCTSKNNRSDFVFKKSWLKY
jgi:hypothetical protein